DFQIDLNGKKFAWQGVALLPFVEENRLRETLKDVYDRLEEDEIERNTTGPDRVFVGANHTAFAFFKELYEGGSKEGELIELDSTLTYGMNGKLAVDKRVTLPGQLYVSPLADCDNLEDNRAIMAVYRDPEFAKDHVFSAKRLEGAVEPPKTLKPQDYNDRREGRYQPQIGFTRDIGRASLDAGGHRMMRHELGVRGDSGGGGGGYDNRRYNDRDQNGGRDRGGHNRSYSSGGSDSHRDRGGYGGRGGSRGGSRGYDNQYGGGRSSYNQQPPPPPSSHQSWRGSDNQQASQYYQQGHQQYGRGGQGQYQQTPAAYGQQQQPRNTYQQQGQPSG
uniref:Xrn1 helical domain-containing protein n=1 Tax=Plectus sambesii TaxID=2011161 RepID=A0A914V340_9BILA